MREIQTEEFGRILVRQIPFPEGVIPDFVHYTWSGRVACSYRREGDPEGYLRIMTLNDDGTDVNEIWAGDFKHGKSNGFRYMPFKDNKRAYIGDYILECTPDCDHTEKAELIPIHYPDKITKSKGRWMIWSENVVAPDNEHIAWSTLGLKGGVYIAKLRRTEANYELDDLRCVSTVNAYKKDPKHRGCVIEEPARGGEVKQFVRGGRGLSYVGMGRGAGNSMLQALDSEEVVELNKTPCYDETTILSPDEKLGITMSTRFSKKTGCGIIGLIPRRGNMMTKSSMVMNVYLYAVAGARAFREGANVGPALVTMERSVSDMKYTGVDLHDPGEEWIYYSPMSWHPSGKKVMWNERLRKDLGDRARVSIAELLDYVPGDPVENAGVPENIPYAKPGVQSMSLVPKGKAKQAGLYSGKVITKSTLLRKPKLVTTVYENFSDDGKTFINGFEKAETPGLLSVGNTVYDADITVTGEHTGEMKVHLVFERSGREDPVRIGKESEGYAEYDGERISVSDMDFN